MREKETAGTLSFQLSTDAGVYVLGESESLIPTHAVQDVSQPVTQARREIEMA